MLLKSTIIWLTIFLMIFEETSSKNQKVIQIRTFQSCSQYPDLPIMLIENKRKSYTNYTHTVKMIFSVKKRIESNIEGKFNLQKCDLSGSPDSCEHYVKDLKMKQICKKMQMKNQVWTNFVEGFKPPVQCPVESGKYEVIFTISSDVFKFFPLPRGVWKSQIFLYAGEEMLNCMYSEVRVIERQLR